MKIRQNPAGYLIMLALTVLIAVVGCGPQLDVPTYTPSTHAPVSQAPTLVQATTQPAKPAGTVSQQQAVAKAESYLNFQAFSKKSLVEQLKYEGFSDADSKYAVDNITVDWLEQAAKKAESYLDHQAFSRSGLIGQLKFEGFTAEEAKHGADAVGLK